jgi:hypothetical protein
MTSAGDTINRIEKRLDFVALFLLPILADPVTHCDFASAARTDDTLPVRSQRFTMLSLPDGPEELAQDAFAATVQEQVVLDVDMVTVGRRDPNRNYRLWAVRQLSGLARRLVPGPLQVNDLESVFAGFRDDELILTIVTDFIIPTEHSVIVHTATS